MEKVRVIRVLEYVGDRKWVEAVLEQRAIKGTKNIENGGIIREAILGDFPEIVEQIKDAFQLSAKEDLFMKRFGWEDSIREGCMIKRDLQTGKVLAHEGDETWTRDLKVAGE